MTIKRRDLLGGALLAAGSAWSGAGWADEKWPRKPVRMVIGYTTGGAADTVARAVGTRLERLWGQPIVYEYKPGAGAAIGVDFTVRAPGDGYTVGLIDSGSVAIVPNLRKVPYDPETDLAPLAYLGGAGLVLVVHPGVQARNLRELIALLRARPGEFAYSSSGIGSPQHVAGEMFKLHAGVNIRHVPYKGAAPALNDLMGGQIQLSFATIAPAIPVLETGRAHALGVTGASRSAALPQVPTFMEGGLPDYDMTPWFAFAGPGSLPKPLIQQINASFSQVLADPELTAALEKLGVEQVRAGTPAELAARIKADRQKYAEVIRRAAITLDG